MTEEFHFYDKQVVIKSSSGICRDSETLIDSSLFRKILKKYIDYLIEKDSPLLEILKNTTVNEWEEYLLNCFNLLCQENIKEVVEKYPQYSCFLKENYAFHQFVERLYDFWRHYERFFIKYDSGKQEVSKSHKKPYRAFNQTIEQLNHLVRKTYRNICENITGEHPQIYRQVPAGCQVGLITTISDYKLPDIYKRVVKNIPLISQILIEPPLIIDPLMNKRAGQFEKIDSNPLEGIKINSRDWLCFPVKVGGIVIYFYFYNKFIGLGTALANLFELAYGEDLSNPPKAIFLFGTPLDSLQKYGQFPTVFYEDIKNDLLVAAMPALDEIGYFGYIKKMILTLHNIVMMKKGRLPVHGAMVRICLKNNQSANIVIVGDTGAGKSETLEAFRILAEKYIREMVIIYDDMGSLEITKEEDIKGYGTEVGAFVRLDDLQPGYAFGVIDRSIIMSPHKVNARAVIPITTSQEILKGYEIDYFLYANNHEEVNDNKPVFEEILSVEEAISVFREGVRLAKGTTTEKGMVRSYFSNIFGPVQYKELHEELVQKYFNKLFKNGIKVGQLRTRLGISGYERKGPEMAARELLKMINKY